MPQLHADFAIDVIMAQLAMRAHPTLSSALCFALPSTTDLRSRNVQQTRSKPARMQDARNALYVGYEENLHANKPTVLDST